MATSSLVFPNGQVLQSSAMTPQSVATMFQKLALLILGIPVDPQNPGGPAKNGKPAGAYWQVRVGYQPDGQPAWEPEEDVCIITCRPVAARFSKSRDRMVASNDDLSVTQLMSFSQEWRVKWVFYGPQAYARASLMISAMDVDWVEQWLQAPPAPFTPNGFFFIPQYDPPIYAPENFARQWWNRVDVELRYYELVKQSIIIPAADSVDVIITTNTGQTRDFEV